MQLIRYFSSVFSALKHGNLLKFCALFRIIMLMNALKWRKTKKKKKRKERKKLRTVKNRIQEKSTHVGSSMHTTHTFINPLPMKIFISQSLKNFFRRSEHTSIHTRKTPVCKLRDVPSSRKFVLVHYFIYKFSAGPIFVHTQCTMRNRFLHILLDLNSIDWNECVLKCKSEIKQKIVCALRFAHMFNVSLVFENLKLKQRSPIYGYRPNATSYIHKQ